MTYKLVIFDFDGTLADSFPWFLGVFNEVADKFGFKRIADHEVDFVRGLGLQPILRHFEVPAWKLPLIAAHLRRLSLRDAAEIPLFAGAEACLEALAAKGVALAIVSSNAQDSIRRVLGPRTAGLVGHFECGASLFGKGPRIAKVIRRSGVPPRQALAIGDEVRDLDAAAEAGIAAASVSWGYATPAALRVHGPARLFTSFDEVARAVGSD